jgi:hypothetical protein
MDGDLGDDWDGNSPPKCGIYDQHPMRALPPRENPYELVSFVVRANWRWAITHPMRNTPEEKNWYGHTFLMLRAEGKPDRTVGFYPRYCLSEKFGNRKVPERIAAAGYTRKTGFIPSVAREMWKRVAGKVCDDSGLHFDSCAIYPLTEVGYHTAMARIDFYKNTPPPYRVVGWWGVNCVKMCHDIMDHAGIRVSAFERLVRRAAPWPIYESQRIEWTSAWRSLTGRKSSAGDPRYISGDKMSARVRKLAQPAALTAQLA